MQISNCIFFFIVCCSVCAMKRKKCFLPYTNIAQLKSPFRIEYQFQRNVYKVPDIFDENSVLLRHPEYDLSPRFKTNNVADVVPMQVSCRSQNVTSALKELRQQIKCVPRDSVVNLKAPEGFMVSPNTVMVKKCGGMCNGAKTCLSKNTKLAFFYVRSVNFETNEVICSSILVPEDTACRCGCETKITDCLPTQKYDKNMCTCKCTNMDDYQKCIQKSNLNFKWEEKTCRCVCSTTKICTTGSHWVPSQCRCAKLFS